MISEGAPVEAADTLRKLQEHQQDSLKSAKSWQDLNQTKASPYFATKAQEARESADQVKRITTATAREYSNTPYNVKYRAARQAKANAMRNRKLAILGGVGAIGAGLGAAYGIRKAKEEKANARLTPKDYATLLTQRL